MTTNTAAPYAAIEELLDGREIWDQANNYTGVTAYVEQRGRRDRLASGRYYAIVWTQDRTGAPMASVLTTQSLALSMGKDLVRNRGYSDVQLVTFADHEIVRTMDGDAIRSARY